MALNPKHMVKMSHLHLQKMAHFSESLQAVLTSQHQQQLHYKPCLSQLEEVVLNK